MKADKVPDIERALASPDPAVRCWLCYGPDEGAARAAADRLTAHFGGNDPLARTDFTNANLREDPTRLSAEAAAVSMFGDAKVIRVDGVSEAPSQTIKAAVELLLAAPEAGNPVVLAGGDIKATTALAKMVGGSGQGAALRFYLPDARAAGGIARDMCTAAGLQPDRDVTAAIADMVMANRAVAANEVEKFALYLGAAPDDPKPLSMEVLDMLGAAFAEGDFSNLTAAVAGGDPAKATREHARLLADNKASVGQLRALQRRFAQLVSMARGTEQGRSAKDVVEAEGRRIFWKEKPQLVRQLSLWSAQDAERALERLAETEIATKSSGVADADLLTAATILALSRRAAAHAARRG
ncbi:MAG: DNA polymerase III subunit delta [Pacificimonas sp.]